MTEPNLSVATDDHDTLGGRLVRAREAANLSTEALAEQVGVTLETLEAWESDRSEPRSNRLTMLAGIMGVSPTWLLFGRGTSPSEAEISTDIEAIQTQLAVLRQLHEQTGNSIRMLEAALRKGQSDQAA